MSTCKSGVWISTSAETGVLNFFMNQMVPEKGIEPPTFSLRMNRSTN